MVQVDLNVKNSEKEIFAGNESFVYCLNVEIDSEMRKDYLVREVVNRIQKSRKEAGVLIEDKIVVLLEMPAESKELS